MNSKLNVLAFAALCAASAGAIPQSPVITYGLVRDQYGNPLKGSSALTLSLVKADAPDGQVYAKTVVGDTPYPAVNYRLSLEIDSEGPKRPYAVLEGAEMRIRFQIGGEEQTAAPAAVFTVPANGTAQRKDYSLGADVDGDGLPDAWEEWVLEVGGQASGVDAIAAFKPEGDADADGMSNWREFLAGTDPFLATDLFAITSFEKLAVSNRTKIVFTTVPGRTYRLVATPSLEEPVWAPVATSRFLGGATAYETYPGTGRDITLYIDTPLEDEAYFRVAAQ